MELTINISKMQLKTNRLVPTPEHPKAYMLEQIPLAFSLYLIEELIIGDRKRELVGIGFQS